MICSVPEIWCDNCDRREQSDGDLCLDPVIDRLRSQGWFVHESSATMCPECLNALGVEDGADVPVMVASCLEAVVSLCEELDLDAGSIPLLRALLAPVLEA